MGKMILISVTSASLLGAIMLHRMHRSTASGKRQLDQYRSEELARENALAGFARAKRHVWSRWTSSTFAWTDTLTGSYAHGSYTANVDGELLGDTLRAEIAVTSTFAQAGIERTREIDAVFTAPKAPPAFMREALLSGGDLGVSGDVLISAEDTTVNANVHANGDLTVDGTGSSVAGFGTFAGTLTANPSGSEIFDPNSNPEDEPITEQTPEVHYTGLNAPDYESEADRVTTGDLTWSGSETVDFTSMGSDVGTEENPAIWYVDGSLGIGGTVTVQGYGMIVVAQQITTTDSAVTEPDSDSPGWWGLYADGDVTISGEPQLHGQIYSDSTMTVDGNPQIHGSLSGRRGLDVPGTPDITYRPAKESLTEPIWESGAEDLTIANYSEW